MSRRGKPMDGGMIPGENGVQSRNSHKKPRNAVYLELEARHYRRLQRLAETQAYGKSMPPTRHKMNVPVALCTTCTHAFYNRWGYSECDLCRVGGIPRVYPESLRVGEETLATEAEPKKPGGDSESRRRARAGSF